MSDASAQVPGAQNNFSMTVPQINVHANKTLPTEMSGFIGAKFENPISLVNTALRYTAPFARSALIAA